MSETDDTDDLLLIPPGFFSVDTELETPYYNIVDSLISQVNNLQNRIDTIECTSDLSLIGSYLDNSFDNTHTMSSSRKYSSSDEIYRPQSTQSTPQKPQTKFKVNSLPNTPNINRFSPRSRLSSARKCDKPFEEDTPILNEIDSFLSNVRTIQRLGVSKNLQEDFTKSNNPQNTKQGFTSTNSNIQSTNTNNKIYDIIENGCPQPQKSTDTALNNNKIDTYEDESQVSKEKTWCCGDDVQTIPDYDAGVRKMFASQTNSHKSDLKPPNSSLFYGSSYKSDTKPSNFLDYGSSFVTSDKSDSSSDSTQLTAFNNKYETDKHNAFNSNYTTDNRNDLLHSPLHANALNVLDQHKKLLDNSTELKEKGEKRSERVVQKGVHTLSDNIGLLSLADIWTGSGNHGFRESSKLLQKLEEEKLRRQHCETLIHDLQTRNLELQQKIAVAVKVDESKNNTIQQFKQVLEKFAVAIEKNNKEKLHFENELKRISNQYKTELADSKQKISYYEKEVSKALHLAHGNQEKICCLESKCAELQNELHNAEKRLKEFQEKYFTEFEKNKQLSVILSQKEMEINENKNIINDARSEVSQSRRAVELCQTELNSLKSECARHQAEMKEDKSLIITLNEQKRQLLNDIETYKSKEKALNDELVKAKKQIETNKVELRNFYQGQVEILVQNKLKEFQDQLDKTDAHCKEEIKKRELSIARTAASHIQQISEKFALEQQLVETKHNEELTLYQIQIRQLKQEIDNLQSKVGNMHDKRHHIARQLQKIMETQWNEALRIIASGKSPTVQDRQNFNTIDQLNSLKTRSYTNFEEVLSQHEYDQGDYDMGKFKNGENYGNNMERVSHDEINVVDTPVSSKPPKLNDDIQKYINLLLNKQPGNPTAEMPQEKQDQNHDNRVSWQPQDQEDQNKQQFYNGGSKCAQRDKKFGKPPWK